MADRKVEIKVSYNGLEKSLPLVVRPGLELSDLQVDCAEETLHGLVRKAFTLAYDAKFYLHEAESGRIMSVESFRDPANFPRFPPHWYLVVEGCKTSDNSIHLHSEKHNGVLESDVSPDGHAPLPPLGGTEFEEGGGGGGGGYYDVIPSLAELSPSETRYHSVTLRCDPTGRFGLNLRHFSIQPDCIPRSTTPNDHAHLPRPVSRCSSDSLEALKLSTTFIHTLQEGGVAKGEGLEAGLVVHMINGASILRCSPDEISKLLRQCGDELTFLMLPKDHDDLQFFYPKYTEGRAGNFTSSDGTITVFDIPVLRGVGTGDKNATKPLQNLSETSDHNLTNSNGSVPATSQEHEVSQDLPSVLSLPPTGLMPFSEDDPSQEDNSLPTSSEIFPAGRENSSDDILIAGSLSEIENTWDSIAVQDGSSLLQHSKSNSVDSAASWRNMYPPSDRKGSAGIEFTPGELDFITEDPTTGDKAMEWYRHRGVGGNGESDYSLAQERGQNLQSSSKNDPSLPLPPTVAEGNPRLQEQRLNDLALKHRTSSESRVHALGTGNSELAMAELDRFSPSRPVRSKSTELGNMRIRKKGNKSLETLTRVGATSEGRGAEFKRHRSDEHAHRIRHLTPEDLEQKSDSATWLERSTNSMPGAHHRGATATDPALSPLGPAHSGDDPQTTSEDSIGGSLPQGVNEGGVPNQQQQQPGVGGGGRQRKTTGRSYQSARAKLHKARSSSRTESVESETGMEPRPEMEPRHGGRIIRRASAASDFGRRRRTHSPSPYLDETPESPRASERPRLATPVTSTPEPRPRSPTRPSLLVSEPEKKPIMQNSTGHIRQHSFEQSAKQNHIDHAHSSHSQSSASPSYRSNNPDLLLQGKRQRPVSAVDASFRHAGLDTPNKAHHCPPAEIQSSGRHSLTRSVEAPKKIAIYHTRSANTPYGQQIVTEVNIEEAIRASQQSQSAAVVSPAMRCYSNDSGVVMGGGESVEVGGVGAKKWRKKNFPKQDFIYEMASSAERLYPQNIQRSAGTETPPTVPSRVSSEHLHVPSFASPQPTDDGSTDVRCHGVLIKKQDRVASGKRAQDRSWKSYYAVLRETRLLSFYRDRREANLRQSCDEPSIDVTHSSTEVAQNYSKKKYVIRIATAQGSEYLLQAEDVCSMQRWVSAIQQVSGDKPVAPPLNRSRDQDTKLAPPPSSPVSLRRFSSPQPQKNAKKKDEKGLLDRLKRWKRSREEEPDFSSYSTFGQALADCPMSLENKRVPLVVEFCVNHTESEGLEIEGLYRKAGQMTVTTSLSVELDKGNYDLPDTSDIHTITSLLKKFFKELPDPLVPMAMYYEFVSVGQDGDDESRMSRLKELVLRLPTAHYHTFKYLMTHLNKISQHSGENKMTPRNVSLVFGPTLLRSPTEEEQLLSMNAGYAIVELLCTHVDFFFDADLCLEEQQVLEQASASAAGGVEPPGLDEVACRGSPLPSFRELSEHPSRGAETSQQKIKALATASPKSVRRIKNDLSNSLGGGAGMKIRQTENRNSFIPIEGSITLPPKQHNRGSDTLRSAHSSNSSISGGGGGRKSPDNSHFLASSLPPQSRQSVGGSTPFHLASSKRRIVRHSYEDIEMSSAVVAVAEPKTTDSVSRTRRWVNHHRDMNWGIDKDQPSSSDATAGSSNSSSSSRGEFTGSMWASRNMQQQLLQQQKDAKKDNKKRLSKTRGPLLTSFPPPQAAVEKDFSTSYQEPPHQQQQQQQQQRYSSRPSSIAGAPQHTSGRAPPPVTASNSVSNTMSPRRRISYATAMGDPDVPVRGTKSDRYGNTASTERQFTRERTQAEAELQRRDLKTSSLSRAPDGAYPPRMQKMDLATNYSPAQRKQDAGYTPPRHHRMNPGGGGGGGGGGGVNDHLYSSLSRGTSRSLKKQGSSEFREEDLRTAAPAYSYLNRRSSAGTVTHRSTFTASPPERGSSTALPQQLESYL